VGRPTLWTPEIEAEAWQYLEDYKDVHDHAIPSVVGLCRVLGIGRSTLYDWAAEEDKDIKDILEAVKEAQEFVTLNEALQNNYNSAIAKLVLGKHGYSDKQDNTLASPTGGAVQVENTIIINPVANGTNRD